MSPFAVVATQDGSLNPMFLFSVDYSNDTWWTNLMRKYPVQPQVVVSGYFSSRLRLWPSWHLIIVIRPWHSPTHSSSLPSNVMIVFQCNRNTWSSWCVMSSCHLCCFSIAWTAATVVGVEWRNALGCERPDVWSHYGKVSQAEVRDREREREIEREREREREREEGERECVCMCVKCMSACMQLHGHMWVGVCEWMVAWVDWLVGC